MIKRFVSLIIGLMLVGLVIWLGSLATNDGRFVLWFGLASAILAPIGLGLLRFSVLRSDRRAFESLAKVPEIRTLIGQAKSEEQRIQILELERDRLETAVRLEAERLTLQYRKDTLEKDALLLLAELENIDSLSEGLDLKESTSTASDEIQRLRQRLRARTRGDIVFRLNGKEIIIPRVYIPTLPYTGDLLYQLIWHLGDFQQRRYRKSISKKQNRSQ